MEWDQNCAQWPFGLYFQRVNYIIIQIGCIIIFLGRGSEWSLLLSDLFIS
jgi:hypothetical protein